MFRTLHTAGAVTALAGLIGFLPPHAASAGESSPPYAIVAQSTSATAATGRRPLGQRIAASNLPVRATRPIAVTTAPEEVSVAAVAGVPVPSDPATPDDPSAATEPAASTEPLASAEPSASDLTPPAAETEPDADIAAVPAEPAMVETEASPASGADAASEPAALVELVMEPAPAEPTPAIPDAEPASPSPDIAAAADTPQSGAAGRAGPVAPVPLAHARPALQPAVRANLLGRIKTAFGMKPAEAGQTVRSPRPQPAVVSPAHRADDTGSTPVAEPTMPPSAAGTTPAAVPALALEQRVDDLAIPAAGEPARLEFDVRESRKLVGEGEQIVMRIAVRNVGGDTAERVTATLFFAEGIEPVQAIGHAAELYPGEVRFETVPELSPGASVDLLVTAVGTRPGSVAYRGEIESCEPAGRVAREGSLTIRPRHMAAP